ncbi:hypothetical protein [Nocardioides aromaticivorans]|nr:hypothetical protein [Nocardioides aromaticivorans]
MPEQHDPIDELARFGAGFGSATPGGDMPLSAADVRRRGDQIRRRRTALVAGGAALAVAAVAVPVFAVIGNGDPRGDKQNIAVENPPLSRANLLRDADTEYDREGYSLFTTTETFEGDGQAVYLPCQREAISALGASDSLTRVFNLAPDPEKMSPGDTFDDQTDDDMVELVAQFDSPDAARTAYDRFAEWIVDCEIPGADTVRVGAQGRSVDVADGDAVVYDINWGPVPQDLDPTGDFAYIGEIGLVVQDDRIAVLKVTAIGQDYNWLPEDGGSPLERMLPKAAQRLALDGAPNQPTETTEPTDTVTADDGRTTGTGEPDPGPGGPDAIPDDFPIFAGWPEEAGDGEGRIGPERPGEPPASEACGEKAADPEFVDRLRAEFHNAEDYRSRVVTTYANADEAVAAVAAIRQVYADCPTGEVRDDGYTPHWAVVDTQIGGDSFAVLGWDTLGDQPTPYGDTLLVVRLGSSVLVVAHGGESGAPSGGDDQRAVDQIVQESAPVVDAMCTWTAAGC